MTSRGSAGGSRVRLPEVVPFEVSRVSRENWENGSRVAAADASSLRGRWGTVGSSWEVSVFVATRETVLLRVRTPVGRERFYETTQRDVQGVVTGLSASSRWRRLD
ncbi:hypothetical protein [Salarchaeum sp. JOR-1]|uniref:hypothetical protein n=1 Tax=Salarchaeum sp. JOR-1 TaxID=2599399 RepID=UPI00119895D3|nr:hypothetical protein [Salarchaeum sp. JOR-1]QDX41724.1 hypothetical protein FQU85_12705 [Salarchaeum sp. JOR-1]